MAATITCLPIKNLERLLAFESPVYHNLHVSRGILLVKLVSFRGIKFYEQSFESVHLQHMGKQGKIGARTSHSSKCSRICEL